MCIYIVITIERGRRRWGGQTRQRLHGLIRRRTFTRHNSARATRQTLKPLNGRVCVLPLIVSSGSSHMFVDLVKNDFAYLPQMSDRNGF